MHTSSEATLLTSPRTSAAGTSTLRVLTLNLGLNGLRVGRRFAISAHIDERLTAAPALIETLAPDIIALQEVYDRRDQGFLASKLSRSYPFAFTASAQLSLYGNGLMFLSKLPIRSGRFVPFRGGGPSARWLWEPGFLLAEIGAEGAPALGFINVHLVANEPLTRLNATPTHKRRSREIRSLIALGRGERAILVGDFNTSPVIAPEIYVALMEAGYRDTFVATNGACETPTWDSTNLLNRIGVHRREPSQRIDHVFVPNSLRAKVAAEAASIVLREPCIELHNGQRCTLSDHYGLLVTLATY
jgi:endonuclease/exonuclease/phosphatase family metal-dependent hydrolase